MKVPNIAEFTILESLIDTVLSGVVYHLFKNNLIAGLSSPDDLPTVVLEDLTEADFPGYDAGDGDMEANEVAWGAPILEGDGRVSTTGDGVLEFVRGAGEGNNDIYGWYKVDALGNLLALEAFVDGNGNPEPFAMEVAGDTIRIRPYFSLQSRDEVECEDDESGGGEDGEDGEGAIEVVVAVIGTLGLNLTIQFSEDFSGSAGFTVNASGGPVTLTYNAGLSGGHFGVYDPDRTILAGETVTLDYSPGDIDGASGPLAAFTDFPVNNTSTATGGEGEGEGEGGAPALLSAVIDTSGIFLTLTFDTEVTGVSGFDLLFNGTDSRDIEYDSGEFTASLVFGLAITALMGETFTLNYTPGDVAADGGGPLAEFLGFSVTNNSTESGGE